MTNIRPVLCLLATLTSGGASAGVYTDALGKCLVDNTTMEDRTMLVRWLFTAASAHPAISSLSTVSAADRDAANETTARLFVRLLTDSCKDAAQTALKFEGAAAIQLSFQVLGQVAGAELFSNPQVAAAMGALDKHMDPAALEALKAEPAKP